MPKWRTRPALEVTADDLLAVLNAKLRDGAPVAANRVRALVSRIYTFGAEQRLVPATVNPVIGVKEPTKDITSVYDRYGYDAEKRRAMEFWDRLLTAILANKSFARVGRFAV